MIRAKKDEAPPEAQGRGRGKVLPRGGRGGLFAGWDQPLCFVLDACAEVGAVLSADPLRPEEPAAP